MGQCITFFEVLTNIRIASAEIGGTVTLVLLIIYGTHKAWNEFIVELFKRNDKHA